MVGRSENSLEILTALGLESIVSFHLPEIFRRKNYSSLKMNFLKPELPLK